MLTPSFLQAELANNVVQSKKANARHFIRISLMHPFAVLVINELLNIISMMLEGQIVKLQALNCIICLQLIITLNILASYWI